MIGKVFAGAAVAAVAALAADAPAVTFHKDVEPILQANCQSCHRPGQIAPMSFLTYQATRPWAKAMKAATAGRKMPPWFADSAYGHFTNDRSLKQSEIDVISQWADNGAPEGDLMGLNIGVDGLVNATYSNGSQVSLGKIVLVNFSNPNGLRQIGDSSFYSSSASGTPKLGEAGAAGLGTIRAGATERANVDLTQELVDLITGQRNFQASAKAIETNTALTQAIINIRS